ncbi:MAG: tetratricopeptide repeat protein [Candidatus Kaiserbacteria bacterium]|nr:MAG: tetratricopeptide repeat protein [Candidatus Kaiserbacteria bacterium]
MTVLLQNAQLLFFPSAASAYNFGNQHFDARSGYEYDIDRAESLYQEALRIDPQFPYARHQLARISFLRGDFKSALVLINEELFTNPDPSPSSYYIRGLIEGYAGRYDDAAKSYERYLERDPRNWAAINDYAWVLLRAGRSEDAAIATAEGLAYFPENPWLLNSNATALFELGLTKEASAVIQKAGESAASITEPMWLTAYPGNDPRIARQGIETLQRAIASNKLRFADPE